MTNWTTTQAKVPEVLKHNCFNRIINRNVTAYVSMILKINFSKNNNM